MKYIQSNAVVNMRFKDVEEVQDLNSDAIACNSYEGKLLIVIDNLLDFIDGKDCMIGNEPEVEQAKKVLRQARELNMEGLNKDKKEMRILDDIVPMFPEHCIRRSINSIKNRALK
ncbi:hypothetical protein LLG07_06120 [bacterium]|nr:hypothetical protein [bacterium]